MWRISVTEPNNDSRTIELSAGKLCIGRHAENGIVLQDVSASRVHAEITLNTAQNQLTITDLNSTNGTYVNRQRVSGSMRLNPNDIIRIGQAVIYVSQETISQASLSPQGSHLFTRELLLESLDEHAVLLYEVAKRLNTIVNIDSAMDEIRVIMKRTLAVDVCQIIPRKDFPNIHHNLPGTSARQAIENRSAELTSTTMLVPVVSGEELLGLIYFAKSHPNSRAFSRRDLQLAIAISHQVALTIQRTELIEKLKVQEHLHQLLTRFVPPEEAEQLIKEYMQTGSLPGLREAKVTILFNDIAGSTALAENIGAQRFAETLGRYYQIITSAVFQQGGTVRYLGDGVMAIFEDRHEPQNGILAEERAVRAGLVILDKIQNSDFGINQQLISGTAINTGPAMIGYVGGKEMMEFNVLGDTVNVAFRMQDLARPNRLVVGPATVAAIVNKYPTQRIGGVSIKGREKPIQVYEILRPQPENPQKNI